MFKTFKGWLENRANEKRIIDALNPKCTRCGHRKNRHIRGGTCAGCDDCDAFTDKQEAPLSDGSVKCVCGHKRRGHSGLGICDATFCGCFNFIKMS